MIKLIFFGTSGCHLCEEAELILTGFNQIELELIDIAEQPQWQEKYAIRIPVLFHDKTERELGWPFNSASVEQFIKELSDD